MTSLQDVLDAWSSYLDAVSESSTEPSAEHAAKACSTWNAFTRILSKAMKESTGEAGS